VSIAVTGHRPDKLGGYRNEQGFRTIRRHMKGFLEEAPDGELELISGGALGIDFLWMQTGILLGFPVVAMLPFEGYDSKWPDFSRKIYGEWLDRCRTVEYVCEPGYHPAKLQRRNEAMVDRADSLVAYWNGSEGGTANCVGYAQATGVFTSVFNPNDILEL
jgi:uncharacterized phage-like protein YoqJ